MRKIYFILAWKVGTAVHSLHWLQRIAAQSSLALLLPKNALLLLGDMELSHAELKPD